MVDRLVAVDDADYRLPVPVLQALASDVGNVATELGAAVEARTFVIDTEYASLEDALAATGVGGVLEVRGAHTRAASWTIDKSATVRFTGAGAITLSSGSVVGITVTASDVTLVNARITGTGGAVSGSGGGIRGAGTLAAPVRNLTIRNATLTGFSRYGIQLEHVHWFTIDTPVISTIAYSGIMILSCTNGIVDGGSVSNLTMPTPFVNAYGIAMTRNSAETITAAPRTSNVTVRGVLVDGVPTWEGIDTHGGENLTIIGNTVLNTSVGIALVSSTIGTTDTYAPRNILVANNIIDSGVTNGTRSNGIVVAGAGSAVGSAIQYATAVITGNTITNHGRDQVAATSAWGAILLQHTHGVVIANNIVTTASICGLHVFHTNYGLVATGNTFEDTWADIGPYAAVVSLRSTDNDLTVSGTQITRGPKTAVHVNSRGLTVASATNNTVADGGGNQWTKATLAQAGGSLVLKSATNGAAPVVRASAITSPTAPGAAYDQVQATSMKTALDAVILAIKNFGITN